MSSPARSWGRSSSGARNTVPLQQAGNRPVRGKARHTKIVKPNLAWLHAGRLPSIFGVISSRISNLDQKSLQSPSKPFRKPIPEGVCVIAASEAIDGCPTFAPAYVGRKRWAQPNDRFRCIGHNAALLI